ncbi:two-component regulator propeller domain-containing protein [Emticicia sp. W12TSBA100-4]|uniref:ligand-binding sensor domain-containing protein n=1 Tax=Emticicia sp. W12TSBA100-4 TaxID=3160965 RepID=UPI0033058EAC
MKIYSLIIALLLLQGCHSKAQNQVSHPKLIIPSGTNQYAFIRSSLQDKSGNMWFATSGAGVYRYDGKGFVNFTMKDGLNSNIVQCIMEDFKGNIWVGTKDGVCRFDGKKFKDFALPWTRTPIMSPFFRQAAPQKGCLPPQNKTVLSMLQDKMGNIWFGTQDEGVFQYNGKTFNHFLQNEGPLSSDGFHHVAIYSIYQEKSGNIWFGSYRYDGKSFKNFPQEENTTKASDTIVKSFKDMLEQKSMYSSANIVVEDKKGDLWFSHACRYGITKYDGKTLTNFTDKDGFCDNIIRAMAADKEGNIWIGSIRKDAKGIKEGCISIYDGKNFRAFPTEKLSNSAIESLFVDKDNNIWIGTREVGLYRYDGKTLTAFTEKPVNN